PDALADRIGRQQELRVTIIDKSGKVIGDSDLDAFEITRVENHIDRPEIQDAIIKGLGISKRYSYTIKKYLLYMAVPFGEDNSAGFLRYAVPISYIEMLEGKLKQPIAVALSLVFLFSLTFTFIISFIVSKPLIEMARIARAMAKGDFSQKPPIYSKDEIGDLAMALSYMSDEIKNKIERIKYEGVKTDAVFSSMSEGIMVVDEKGGILLMNPSLRKLFLVDVEPEMKSPIEVMRNQQIQDIVDKILKDKQRLISKEIVISQPEEKILKINGVPIIRNDILEGAVLVFHDISELRRLERVRQDFVANVSHELRTPISSIKGYAETLLDGAIEDKENAKEFISIIYQDSNRLANLIDDLLDLAKIEAGSMKMNFEPLDIKPVLERCVRVLEKSIKAKKLSISLDIPSRLPKVLADEKRLAQIFLNLLDNAVKYNSERGSIKLSISLSDKLVQVDISDTGIGIPEKDLSRIFERFYRVDKARSRELGGTGLGLSIVKHIVLAHGGQVWAKSEEGLGSTFSFTIPQA
ncbi:MAG: cell wall metabolism sensor histidine kinase WalK, partial [Candidatus Omnitrophica bacterium]|nr:cell wall metabolism sensor histidine kinase WalK [Candidatus Omnitrophota bacterium]